MKIIEDIGKAEVIPTQETLAKISLLIKSNLMLFILYQEMIMRGLVLFTFFGFAITYSIIFYKSIKSKANFFGSAPFKKIFFVVAKLLVIIPIISVLLQTLGLNFRIIPLSMFIKSISVLLFVIGSTIIMMSFYYLGTSVRIGLPKESTTLRTKGIYSISRNPMYVGIYIAVIGSVIYTFNPIIFLMSLIGIYLHHKIVLSEEIFLKKQFGENYKKYCAKVRRYI